jgi:GT2 family glycosyltransferase
VEVVTLVANLTVGIATLNRPSGLARCVDALLSGEVLPAEIIVVDQSANDATQEVVEQRKSNDLKIIYIRQEKCGLSLSRNAVIARASNPIVAVTDDDCVPDRGWVRAIEHAFILSNNTADAVAGRVLPLGPDVYGLYAVSSRVSPNRCEFRGKTMPWIVGTGANFAVKREWFRRVGNFDERLGVGSPGKAGEDADVIYRLLRAGAHLVYEPDAVIYHERQDRARRLATRWSYGYGIGAFCGIWLRRGDPYSIRILGYWAFWQCRDLAIAFFRRQWLEAYQRWLSLVGTLGGLMYGLCRKRLAIPCQGGVQ